jgi:type III secretion HrpO family protein
MDAATLITFVKQALMLTLLLALPVVLVTAITGLIVSFFQAVTQVHDQTTPFAIKLVAAIATIAVLSSWMGGEVMNFVEQLMLAIPGVR